MCLRSCWMHPSPCWLYVVFVTQPCSTSIVITTNLRLILPFLFHFLMLKLLCRHCEKSSFKLVVSLNFNFQAFSHQVYKSYFNLYHQPGRQCRATWYLGSLVRRKTWSKQGKRTANSAVNWERLYDVQVYKQISNFIAEHPIWWDLFGSVTHSINFNNNNTTKT